MPILPIELRTVDANGSLNLIGTAFKSEVDARFALVEGRPEGLIAYVGQPKQFVFRAARPRGAKIEFERVAETSRNA